MKLQNDITENFKIYLQQLGYSKSSTNMLPYCVSEFLRHAKPMEIKEIGQEQIQNFYEYLQNRPHKQKQGALSESFIHHHIYSLKVFFNWLEQTGKIIENPISNLRFKRPKPNTRESLSQEEINQLFENTINSKETAILHLFYSCGLRRAEAENLNTSDIHFNTNLLYVREGKGAKRRVIPINEQVKKDLESYYNNERVSLSFGEGRKGGAEESRQGNEKEVFMTNERGNRMSGNSYNRALKEILKRAEIEKEITLHHLRHSIATHLLENGLSIEFVRDFLGHSHLEATQIYAKVSNYQLKKL